MEQKWGGATYEFENSTNRFYGLQNINDEWLCLFNPTTNKVDYIIPRDGKPTGLIVRADEDEIIDKIEITLPDITVAEDSSKYRNDGILYGPKWAAGKIGQALNFDGADDYVQIPDSGSLDITDAITMMAWVKPSGTGNRMVLAKAWSDSWLDPYVSYDLMVHRDQRIEVRFDHHLWQGTVGSLTNNVWQHIAATYDSNLGKLRFYVNGLLDLEFSVTKKLTPTAYPLYIGSGVNAEYFNGIIGEVRIYSRALRKEEIKHLYELGRMYKKDIKILMT
jgi:hypothetical protein